MLTMRLIPLLLTPYLPSSKGLDVHFTESRFDEVVADGVRRFARVINPVKVVKLDLNADDFSIKSLKRAGLADKLQPCSRIRLSPLECSDLVSEQINVLSDKEISLKLSAASAAPAEPSKPAAPAEPAAAK